MLEPVRKGWSFPCLSPGKAFLKLLWAMSYPFSSLCFYLHSASCPKHSSVFPSGPKSCPKSPSWFQALIPCLLLASFSSHSQALTRKISQAHWWPRTLAHILPSPQKLPLSFCPALTVTAFRLDVSCSKTQGDSTPFSSGPSAGLISLHTSHYHHPKSFVDLSAVFADEIVKLCN